MRYKGRVKALRTDRLGAVVAFVKADDLALPEVLVPPQLVTFHHLEEGARIEFDIAPSSKRPGRFFVTQLQAEPNWDWER